MNVLIRFLFATAVALLIFGNLSVIAFAEGNEASFAIRPARYDPARPATKSYFTYESAAGDTISDEVQVRNTGSVSGTVRLYAVDAATAQTSGVVYRSKADPRQGVGNWIKLEQSELTLAGGEERTIRFTVTIPADAHSGQHLGGLIAEDTTLKQGAVGGALQANIQTRIITAMQINLPGVTVEQMAIHGITPSGASGYQTLVVRLSNDGTTMVKPTGSLTVTDKSGQEVQRIPLQLNTFLPQTAIDFPVNVERQVLNAGSYHAQVQLTYGTSGITSYETDFQVTQAQATQVFKASAPLNPPADSNVNSSASNTSLQSQWPLFAGGVVLLVLALAGGIFLGRRGRATGITK